MKCRELIEILEELAPVSLACDWDNPGLLAGRSDKEVRTVYLALDATDDVIDNAVECRADMIITHHPLIFKPLKKVNDEDFISRRILKMIQNDISYYAMHTNFDAAPGCMADLAGERLGLKDTRVLELMGKTAEDKDYGIGIYGCFGRSMTLRETAEAVKKAYGIPFVTVFGNMEGSIRTAAICPGAGGSTLKEALKCGADVYITGDIGHHEGIDLAPYFTEEEQNSYMDSYIEEGKIGLNGELEIFPVAKSTEIMMMNKTVWDEFSAAAGVSLEDLKTKEGVVRVAEHYYNWTDGKTPDIPYDGKAFYGRDAVANLFIIGSMQLGVELFHVENQQVTLQIDKDVFKRIWDCYYVPYVKGYFGAYGKFRSDDVKIGELIAYTGSTTSAGYFPDLREIRYTFIAPL